MIDSRINIYWNLLISWINHKISWRNTFLCGHCS